MSASLIIYDKLCLGPIRETILF